MKKFILSITALVFAMVAFTQNAKFTAAMQKGLVEMEKAQNADDMQKSANYFERIANAEKEEWLPSYYYAYSLIMKAYMGASINEIDAMMLKADEAISMAEALAGENSELSTIKAMAMTARMQVDGSRAMTLGPKSTAVLQKAIKQEPVDNPRLYMQLAQGLYYTPTAFGGGQDKAKEMIAKCVAAYGTFKPETALHPNWGKEYAEKLQADWSK